MQPTSLLLPGRARLVVRCLAHFASKPLVADSSSSVRPQPGFANFDALERISLVLAFYSQHLSNQVLTAFCPTDMGTMGGH